MSLRSIIILLLFVQLRMVITKLSSYMQTSFLVFGKNGWIGGMVIKLLQEKGYTVIEAESRLENVQDVAAELDKVKPDFVIDAAGLV